MKLTPLETELRQALRNLHSNIVSMVECIEEAEPDGGQSYATQNTRELLGTAWHVMTKCGQMPPPDPRPVLTSNAVYQMHDIDIVYLVDGDKIVMSMSGQVHAPVSLHEAARLLNKYHNLRNVAAEALDETERERDVEDDDGMTDAEADADTLRSAGMGTDEDYGDFNGDRQ